ncbi:hypothetical protein IEO21_03871 [Rhodonia placenta]|uniref:Uncharacterized protein n=1 Tax=Rhodonia placenta TaxID=104341 RepID=A0A8H7U327_9APHY|nr:hypothetical protein IEO21_03871 [Postia placenta]
MSNCMKLGSRSIVAPLYAH